ncbi:transposase [Xanthomonas oryzae pv. oryzae]|uniref:Transposase n=1 Tax=Xanthomonas oryzae pv. oryzae (strain PXO99A) TaxID=360094 RepID=A0A0K0GHQ1_XANOP|nr:transposase [Xanthomonas oryzae pv. oryzae PXO99A]AXQ10720.1 transposase [Xanthomonas oryzae pv. oryzae]
MGSKRRCYSKSGGRRIEQRLYNPPRKILGFKTPLEVFTEEVLNSVANRS